MANDVHLRAQFGWDDLPLAFTLYRAHPSPLAMMGLRSMKESRNIVLSVVLYDWDSFGYILISRSLTPDSLGYNELPLGFHRKLILPYLPIQIVDIDFICKVFDLGRKVNSVSALLQLCYLRHA